MIHSASLINDPFGDPGVYVDFKYRREAFLFDLGDIHLPPPRKLLKIDFIFVSHTHMDHFIGFDHFPSTGALALASATKLCSEVTSNLTLQEIVLTKVDHPLS